MPMRNSDSDLVMTAGRGDSSVMARRIALLGVLGVASAFWMIRTEVARQPITNVVSPTLRPWLPALSLLNPVLFVLLGAWIGRRHAAKFDLRSYVASRTMSGWVRAGCPGIRVAVSAGVAVAVASLFLDVFVFRPRLSPQWQRLILSDNTLTWPRFIGAIGYGGVAEEVMLRWGLLTWAASVISRFRRAAVNWIPSAFGGLGEPRVSISTDRTIVLAIATIVSALAFGAGHLPAAAALGPLDAAATIRIVGVNALAGVVFGALYCVYALEHAMVAHVTAHVVFAAATLFASVSPGV